MSWADVTFLVDCVVKKEIKKSFVDSNTQPTHSFVIVVYLNLLASSTFSISFFLLFFYSFRSCGSDLIHVIPDLKNYVVVDLRLRI